MIGARSRLWHWHRACFFLAFSAALLLTACKTDLWKVSAQEATGGVGAGLSGYQLTPIP